MLLGVGLLVVLVSVLLAGGRPGLLAEARFAAVPALVAALLVQVVILEIVPGAPHAALAAVHVATYALGAVFVYANRSVAGMPAMALGAALNGLVIAVNDGVMPAAPQALKRAGLATEHAGFLNSAPVHGARLQALGDVFASPPGLPFSNVFSVGDVLLLAGAAVFLHLTARSRLAQRPRLRLRRL
jgi:hypothetical protein